MDWNNCWVKSKVWLTLDLKTSIIRSSLCDYSDTYILVKGTITAPNTVAAGAIVNNTHKKVIFKICAPFTDCITKNRNIQEGEAQRIDVVSLSIMVKLIFLIIIIALHSNLNSK